MPSNNDGSAGNGEIVIPLGQGVARVSPRTPRILVVDPDRSTRGQFVEKAAAIGWEADVADKALNGGCKFSDNNSNYPASMPYHLAIITDVGGEYFKGTELARHVAGLRPGMPVYLTYETNAGPKLVKQAQSLVGGERVIQRPINVEGLLPIVIATAQEYRAKMSQEESARMEWCRDVAEGYFKVRTTREELGLPPP